MLSLIIIIACFLFLISVKRSKSGATNATGNTPTPCKACNVVLRAPFYVLRRYRAIFARFNPLGYKYTISTPKAEIHAHDSVITAYKHRAPIQTKRSKICTG